MKILKEQQVKKYILLESNGDGNRGKGKPSWDEEYQNIKTSVAADTFWRSYFKEEWGANAKKMQALGEALILQLKHFGFTISTNPFLIFLRNHYLGGEELPLTADSYAAISNAVNSGNIIKANLTATKVTPDDYVTSLLLCKPLYNQAPKLIQEYFTNAVFFKNNINDTIDTIKTSFIPSGVTITNLFYAIFSNKYTWPFADLNLIKAMTHFDDKTTFRPLTQIRSILQELSGKQLHDKDDATDSRVSDAVSGIKTRAEIATVVAYLILSQATETKDFDTWAEAFNKNLASGIPKVDFKTVKVPMTGDWRKCLPKFAKLKINKSTIETPVLDTLATIYSSLTS